LRPPAKTAARERASSTSDTRADGHDGVRPARDDAREAVDDDDDDEWRARDDRDARQGATMRPVHGGPNHVR